MANTYTQIYIQFVFAVQDRISLIRPEWKEDLYKYIAGIIQNNNHKLIAINGIPNHLHVFIGYKPHQLLTELIRDIKACSSKWINEKKLAPGNFRWQDGYGAFSYSHSHIDKVVNYIINQEQHHRKKTFRSEYIELLQRFNMPFNEKYLLNDVNDQ
jgi:putative transposase